MPRSKTNLIQGQSPTFGNVTATGNSSLATLSVTGAATIGSTLAVTSTVTSSGFKVGASTGIDASIIIPTVGTLTVTKGIITWFL